VIGCCSKIVSAAASIAEFIRDCNPEGFEASQLVRSAVVHQLTVIGEAVARLSQDLRSRHPAVPWADIKGLRNVVVHNYFGIDWAEVWSAAATDVPLLREQITGILTVDLPDDTDPIPPGS
jgi:uncharacterized protein with HEPN domain